MKNNSLDKYKLTRKEVIKLYVINYEFGEPVANLNDFVKFQTINEFADRLIMGIDHKDDENYRFSLNLDANEKNSLRDYLLKNKSFVGNHIKKSGSFTPYTHLYQLYLQYLPDKLNDVEKTIFLAGYINMLEDLHGIDYTEKRASLEKILNLR